MAQYMAEPRGGALFGAVRADEPSRAVGDFGDRGRAARDDRSAAAHRFERRQAEALVKREV